MLKKLLIFLIRAYQILFSPFLGNFCRFHPTCSAYCISAIERYGCIKGLWKGFLRLCKCHPLHPGGLDYP